MIPYGSCVSWRVPPKDNKKVFEKVFGWLQNKVTGQPETHCSMLLSEYPEIGPDFHYEYELSMTARINIFYQNYNCTIYDILAPLEYKHIALRTLMLKTYGNIYAFLQNFIFLIRAIIEKFGGDGRRIWNPLSWLGNCSEGMYMYLFDLARIMKWDDLTEYMKEWNPNVFHSGDGRKVLDFMVEKGYAKRIWN